MVSELREGKFKNTEIGKIPEEWEVKKLGELGEAIIGLTYKPEDLVENGGTLVLRSSNIRGNTLVFDDNKFVNINIPPKLRTRENDILICSRNGSKDLIGKCALINKENEGHSFGAFMTVYRSEYNPFLFYVFNSNLFKKQIYSNLGATINQITTGNLQNFKFAIPPLEEQQKIVSILTTVDKAIQKTEDIIEQTEKVKKGLMQQLLTRGIGHTKFKKTEIGEIPEEWDVVTLQDIVKDTKLGTNDTANSDQGLPLIKMGNLTFGGFNLSKIEYIDSNEEDYKEFLLNDGDFLFNTRNTPELVGKSAVWHNQLQHAIYNNNILKIVFDKNLVPSPDYISYQFNQGLLKKIIRGLVNGTTSVAAIYWKDLSKVEIPLPKNDEQIQISKILMSFDKKIQIEEDKVQRLKSIKKALMQVLLTGKVRVKVDNEVMSQ
jgi:type I restriction enzyme, S subunit